MFSVSLSSKVSSSTSTSTAPGLYSLSFDGLNLVRNVFGNNSPQHIACAHILDHAIEKVCSWWLRSMFLFGKFGPWLKMLVGAQTVSGMSSLYSKRLYTQMLLLPVSDRARFNPDMKKYIADSASKHVHHPWTDSIQLNSTQPNSTQLILRPICLVDYRAFKSVSLIFLISTLPRRHQCRRFLRFPRLCRLSLSPLRLCKTQPHTLDINPRWAQIHPHPLKCPCTRSPYGSRCYLCSLCLAQSMRCSTWTTPKICFSTPSSIRHSPRRCADACGFVHAQSCPINFAKPLLNTTSSIWH